MIKFKKGFTLIELLVVIGILAVLMAGVVALIDPVDKTKQANDATMQSTLANVATAEEAYAAQHGGCYATSWATLFAAGELKLDSPVIPTGYAAPNFAGMSGNVNCVAPTVDGGYIYVGVRSKKYTGATFYKYETNTGKTCAVAAAGTACP